jgi:hypothetical protein
MTRPKKTIYIVGLLFLLFWVPFVNESGANSSTQPNADPALVSWRSLSFKADKMLTKVMVDIELTVISAENAEALLIDTPQGTPAEASSSRVYQIDVNRTIDRPIRATIKEQDRIWFDPGTFNTLGRMRLRTGDEEFKKTYRFTREGVFRKNREPKNGDETRQPPEKWTKKKETFYPFNLEQLQCQSAAERSILIYLASALILPGSDEPVPMCVFGKRQLHRVWMRSLGIEKLKVDYIEKKQPAPTRREGTVAAIKIALESRPLKGNLDEDENFSFLGFQKDIVIYIDPNTRVPLKASGVIPGIGKAKLELCEVEMGSPTE